MPELDRRHFLVTGLAAGAALTIPAPALASLELRTDPFTLGVASGDPGSDGFVLRARLAQEPLAEDGLGGMPPRPFTVRWPVHAGERCRRLGPTGTPAAAP